MITTAPTPGSAITDPTPAANAALGGAADAGSERFAQTIRRARAGQAAVSDDAALRDAAGHLVAAAFVLPMLAEVRSSTMNTDLFGGGFAQDAIQQQLDTRLADELVASPRFPLVEALVDRLSSMRPAKDPSPPALRQREAERAWDASLGAVQRSSDLSPPRPGIDRLG